MLDNNYIDVGYKNIKMGHLEWHTGDNLLMIIHLYYTCSFSYIIFLKNITTFSDLNEGNNKPLVSGSIWYLKKDFNINFFYETTSLYKVEEVIFCEFCYQLWFFKSFQKSTLMYFSIFLHYFRHINTHILHNLRIPFGYKP